jgi:hypothetical protein
MRVVLSVGFSNFHLFRLATELARTNSLWGLLCGAYPVLCIRRALSSSILGRLWRVDRFIQRRQLIQDDFIHSFWIGEAISLIGLLVFKTRGWLRAHNWMQIAAFRLYGIWAAWQVKRAAADGANIYHYRCAYGQTSVKQARQLGLKLVCDHSLVHPFVLDALIESGGELPKTVRPRLDSWSQTLAADIDGADCVIVNSDFVKSTFEAAACSPEKVRVVYQARLLANLTGQDYGFFLPETSASGKVAG